MEKVFDRQSMTSVSRELGVNEGLIQEWKSAALDFENVRQTAAEFSEAAALKSGFVNLKWRTKPKKGRADLRARKLIRHKLIQAEKSSYPIKLLCWTMRVECSVYKA